MKKSPLKFAGNKSGDTLLFAKNFFSNPLRNASITPSSSVASKAMLGELDFAKIHSIVELGPGTGAFTKELIKRCLPEAKIILIELEETYVKHLKVKFGERVVIEHASAHSLDKILEKHKITRPDLLISGLPFFEEAVSGHLLATIEKYTSGGTIFRFFTYMPPAVKRVYKNLPIRMITFVLRNIPPLWIYGVN